MMHRYYYDQDNWLALRYYTVAMCKSTEDYYFYSSKVYSY